MIEPEEVVRRALKFCGEPVIYRLGAGGRDPEADSPLDGDGACDCSGFALWCVGLHRWTKSATFIKAYTPGEKLGWLDSSAIWTDAGGAGILFELELVAEPGALIVYPDWRGSQGHVGIVTQASASGVVMAVAHCSNGNARMWRGKAIQNTPPSAFRRRADSLVCRPRGKTA